MRYGGFPGVHYLNLEDEPVFIYLNFLEQANLVYRCRRYDLRGLRHLRPS